MFNYLMCKKCWKRIRAFQKQFRTPKWIWCVCLWAKSIEKKKCKNPGHNCMKSFLKEYSYFYAPVFSRDFFIFVFIIWRCNKKYRKIGQFWQKKRLKRKSWKNLSYFVKISLVFVPFCQNWYMYIVFYPFHITVTAVR